ncbi:hypothetical protein EFL35_01595 [Weissella paramesenteroides]|uniref:hypothetical protein n=1 Tax=Weissella paramesenteroides TaxID=1249 RepID=UPI00223B3726|nr:hypothetical protein [Weissella paramesenteroides]MCS9983692.1 hypothetical protein [Weissella paramesenteroides]MCS9997945.1 hypothetical protein [Weissella paramesenteroides]MCT0260163.1 hypothetical protein [Weissella paramesenteroides]
MLEVNLSDSLDQKLRNQLIDNFKELDRLRININGYEFSSVNDRINAIEKSLKLLGMPIDHKEEKEMYGGEN